MSKYIDSLTSIRDYLQDRIELEEDPLFDKEQAKVDVEALDMAVKALSDFPYVKYTENGMEPDFEMANAFFNFDAPMVANANQHNSNASHDVEQHTNVLEGDTVSRQAVLRIFGYVMDYWKEHAIDVEPHEIEDAIIEQYEFTAKQLSELPPVTPQPKTGHWISEVTCIGAKIYRCSNCDFTIPKPKTKINYCSNCGCRMFEPQEGSEE